MTVILNAAVVLIRCWSLLEEEGSEKFYTITENFFLSTGPLMNILTPKSPLPTATVEKCLPSEMIASTPDSRTLKKSVSSTIPSTRAAVATNTVFRV